MIGRTISKIILSRAGRLLLFSLFFFGVVQAQSDTEEQPDSATTEQSPSDTVKADAEPAVSVPDTIETPVLRMISDSAVRAAHADPKYAYANDPEYWRRREAKRNDGSGDWLGKFLTKYGRGLRYTFYFLFVSAIIIVLVRTWQENGFTLFRFSRNKRAVQEQLAGTIALDLDEEISRALKKEDWAAAVRFMYLKMLSMAQDKFPDAPESIFSEHAGSSSFRYLRRAYEYVFYGGFPLSATQFEQLQPRFTKAYQTLSS